MKDIDRFVKLFKSVGLPICRNKADTESSYEEYLTLCSGDTKMIGYSGFMVDFNFDKDGKFIEGGIFWE